MARVGIVGTFDVQNFGDVLFPIIAERELEQRLGAIDFRRFAYHSKQPPDWPYSVTTVAELPAQIPDLDGLLIGGGHIIRFDKTIAPGYFPPSKDIHHPTGYWLVPALVAHLNGCPVAWNCPSASLEIPDWSKPLMLAAFQNSNYIAVRDQATRSILLQFTDKASVVPDTCFGIVRLVDAKKPSTRYTDMCRSIGLTKPYVAVQATAHVAGFGEFVRRHPEHFADYQFLSLPVGPVLGDSNFCIANSFDDLVTLAAWPDPTLLAELIAGASCVVGDSLHLAIAGLSFGIPVFRPGRTFEGKHSVLEQYDGVHGFDVNGDIDLAWFKERFDRRGPGQAVRDALQDLTLHWDRVAQCFSPKEANRSMNALGSLITSLPEVLETDGALIEEIEFKLSTKDVEISALNSALSDKHADMEGLKDTVEAQKREIQALRGSTSWKITAGLRALKTIAARPLSSRIIRFKALSRATLHRVPYDWSFANNLFASKDARSLVTTYPRDHFKTVKGYDGEKGYEYEARPLIHLGSNKVSFPEELSEAWLRLAADLLSPDYRQAVSTLTGRDLMGAPMEAYVCHFGNGAWLGPHLDLKEKLMTHVFYFNEDWDPENGGCLNILGSSDMSDCIAQIPPNVGNSSLLVRSNNSWHSVSRVVNGCSTSRRSMNVIFYHPGAQSTMWPPGDTTPLHRYG